MGSVDFESILAKKHHYWRNMIILLVVAAVIGGFFLTDQLAPTNHKAIMMGFIQESLKEEYHPYYLEIEQINTAGKDVYKADWEYGDIRLYVSLNYNSTEEPDLIIGLSQPKVDDLEEYSMGIVDEFFNYEAKGEWECLNGDITSACENVWFEGQNKMSVGVSTASIVDYSIAYACKIVPGSEQYNKYTCASIR